MKKWLKYSSTLPMLSFLGVMACSTVAGDTFVQLKVTADPGSTTIGNALVNPENIEFTVAKVVVGEIELRKSADCSVDDSGEDQGEFEYSGPFVVDLLTEKAKPSFDEVQIEKAKYCKFKFKLDKLHDDEVPSGVSSSDPIVDNSVYIEGVYNSTTPFVVKLDQDEDFEMESESVSGLALANGELNTIFLVFDLGNLFEGVDDLDNLDQTGGVVYIDKDNNQDSYDMIRENLKTFSKLFKDSNDDDQLDDDDDELASGSN